MFEQISFDEKGLVPCVAQDFASGEVLTLAYANEESLTLTVETGELHFYSRSREESPVAAGELRADYRA